jgi:ABC-2 type transport system permease protein
LLSPTLLIQKKMTRLAETDALAAIEYERRIREYHRALRMTYYPWLFSAEKFDKSHLDLLPQFDSTTSGIANSRKNE